ncbi:MAG TPA: hypothetical protein VD948_11410 [Rhodothermales bacterium]|nr:hypothetical protein [Rhodothermales bacterium]
MPYRRIASNYGAGEKSIERHCKNCVAAAIEIVREKREITLATSLIEQLSSLAQTTQDILEESRAHSAAALEAIGQADSPLLAKALIETSLQNRDLALKAIARREKQVEITAKLTGEMQEPRKNEQDLEALKRSAIEEYQQLLNDGLSPEKAQELMRECSPTLAQYVN